MVFDMAVYMSAVKELPHLRDLPPESGQLQV